MKPKLLTTAIFLSAAMSSGCTIVIERPEAGSERPAEPARPVQSEPVIERRRPTIIEPFRPAKPAVDQEPAEVKEIPVSTFSDLKGRSVIPLGMMETGDEFICGKGGEVEDSALEDRDGFKTVFPQIIATQTVTGLRCMGNTYQLIGVSSDNLFELKQEGVPGVVFPLDRDVDLSKATCANVEEANLRSVALNEEGLSLSTIWTSNYLDRGDLQQVHNPDLECVSITFDSDSTIVGPQLVPYGGLNW